VPIGTVAPDQRKDSGSPSDLILTYRNFGDVDFWGADLAAQVFLSDRFSLRGAASWVSEECFDFNDDGSCSSALDVALNAPSRKGNVSARWHDAGTGVTLEGRVRYSDSFPMNSGVYIGDVDSYTVFDANVAYRVPALAGATLSLTANNVFNNLHREFIGAPELGRLLMLRLQYDF
jgi:iron complex outermembrane receptor protein